MKQFNFRRKWRRHIAPLIGNVKIQNALNLGMMLEAGSDFKPGAPPWAYGRSPNRRRPSRGTLAWYQPEGRCHFISPFVYAIALELFPDFKWHFLTSDSHTVIVGERNEEKIVMDILLFETMTADESIRFVQQKPWDIHHSIQEYFRSFLNERATPELMSTLDSIFR